MLTRLAFYFLLRKLAESGRLVRMDGVGWSQEGLIKVVRVTPWLVHVECWGEAAEDAKIRKWGEAQIALSSVRHVETYNRYVQRDLANQALATEGTHPAPRADGDDPERRSVVRT